MKNGRIHIIHRKASDGMKRLVFIFSFCVFLGSLVWVNPNDSAAKHTIGLHEYKLNSEAKQYFQSDL